MDFCIIHKLFKLARVGHCILMMRTIFLNLVFGKKNWVANKISCSLFELKVLIKLN